MTNKRDESPGRSPAGSFDKLLIIVAVLTAATVVLAAVAAIRAPASGAGTDGKEAAGSGVTTSQTAHLTLSEFSIEGDLEIRPGQTVFEVHNDGSATHNLVFEDGVRTSDLNSGEIGIIEESDLAEGSYVVFCDIAGHREAGMETTLVVSAEATGGDEADAHHDDETDWEELDRLMTESMLAFPAETEGKGNQLLEPKILSDGTMEFRLTAAITKWEVESGKLVDAWTYNGMVPGPMIRVDVGDTVRVILDNQLPMGTDIHWHGIVTPNDMDGVAPLTQELVKSGETFVYEFTTEKPAIGMYHAHHHGHVQIPNGMFGVFIIGDTPLPYGQTISGIEIPSDLVIDHEIPLVLNDAGVIGLSLNGKSFPATEPYVGKVGDWVVVHYYNEGLQSHPMHQHQFPQLVFAKDGIPLDSPYWADTINVAPGERYSILLQLEDPGVWVWHCHILTHVERDDGMFGMVTAWIVEE